MFNILFCEKSFKNEVGKMSLFFYWTQTFDVYGWH